MSICAAFNLELLSCDVQNAFLNAKLDELVYVQYPDGFHQRGRVLRLIRALYGLKRSPLLWHKNLDSTVKHLGLVPVPGIHGLYTNGIILLFFYVDDIMYMARPSHRFELLALEDRLFKQYKMKKLGEPSHFLGIRIVRDRNARKLWLCMDGYIEKIVDRFNLQTKAAETPIPLGQIDPYDGEATPQQTNGYQRKVGSTGYAQMAARPDIAYAHSKLSTFLRNPSPEHHACVERCIGYLNATKYLAIEYSTILDPLLECFDPSSDASFADHADMKSTEGWLIKLFGGPIDWKASKQSTVTKSTTEAELTALSHCATEVKWWQNLFSMIDLNLEDGVVINCDNAQTVRLVNDDTPTMNTRLKHVNVHQHWLRQEVQNGNTYVRWQETSRMAADGFTKALTKQQHKRYLDHLNMVDIKQRVLHGF